MIIKIPPRQARAFHRAMAARLGLDESQIDQNFRADWSMVGDDELARVEVSFTAYLPADEVKAMFNESMRGTDGTA